MLIDPNDFKEITLIVCDKISFDIRKGSLTRHADMNVNYYCAEVFGSDTMFRMVFDGDKVSAYGIS